MIEAVTFDLGDTITDLGEGRGDYEARSLARAGRVYDVLAGAGLALPGRAAFCTHFTEGIESRYQASLAVLQGLPAGAALGSYFREAGLPVDGRLLAAAEEAYCGMGVSDPVRLRLGALETLAALQARGLRIGLISNTIQPARYLDASLAARGLIDLCPVRVYSSEAGYAKPHHAIFDRALAELGVSAPQAVHVGDRLMADVYGARCVGMRTVLIEVAHRPEAEASVRPDARIRELPELLQVLANWDGTC